MEYVEQVMVSVFVLHKYICNLIIIFKRQFNTNAVIENHIQSCGSSINKII